MTGKTILEVKKLTATVAGVEILKGIDLTVRATGNINVGASISDGVAGDGEQPGRQHRFFPDRGGLANQDDEDRLRDVLGQVRIAVHLPQRGGIDQPDVAPSELAKGISVLRRADPVQCSPWPWRS